MPNGKQVDIIPLLAGKRIHLVNEDAFKPTSSGDMFYDV
jgi:hypothetical protein